MNYLIVEDNSEIDYKNLKLLKRCLTDGGKIIPARLTGLSRHQQALMARAVKQARILALLPYSVG
jgi:small subunit ribosomal protein S18